MPWFLLFFILAPVLQATQISSLIFGEHPSDNCFNINPRPNGDLVFIAGESPCLLETMVPYETKPGHMIGEDVPPPVNKIVCDDPDVLVRELPIPDSDRIIGPATIQRFEITFHRLPKNDKRYHLRAVQDQTHQQDFYVKLYVPITLEKFGYQMDSNPRLAPGGSVAVVLHRRDCAQISAVGNTCPFRPVCLDQTLSVGLNSWLSYKEAEELAKERGLPLPSNGVQTSYIDVRDPNFGNTLHQQILGLEEQVKMKDPDDPRFRFAKLEISAAPNATRGTHDIYVFTDNTADRVIKIPVEVL